MTKPPGEGPRLDSRAWVHAALDILEEQGIDGVRVEILAKQLGFTKGSFYWHYKDRDALFEAIRRLAAASHAQHYFAAGPDRADAG